MQPPAMNDHPFTKADVGQPREQSQAHLPQMTHGRQRHLWKGRFGPVLIEVAGDRVFVNGQPVERMAVADDHARGEVA